jgi:hypothetical protein
MAARRSTSSSSERRGGDALAQCHGSMGNKRGSSINPIETSAPIATNDLNVSLIFYLAGRFGSSSVCVVTTLCGLDPAMHKELDR